MKLPASFPFLALKACLFNSKSRRAFRSSGGADSPRLAFAAQRKQCRRECTALATAVVFFNAQCVLPLSVRAQSLTPQAKPLAVDRAPAQQTPTKQKGAKDRVLAARTARTLSGETSEFRRPRSQRQFAPTGLRLAQLPSDSQISPEAKSPTKVAVNKRLRSDQMISVAPLNLSKIPTQAQLKAAGGVMGPLDTLGNADEENFKERLSRQFGLASIAEFDEASIAAEAQTAARGAAALPKLATLAQARKRVLRLENINRDFGRAINERNARHFPATAQLMREHLDKYPDSPWAGEAMLHLAMDASHTGRPAEAQARLEALMDVTVENPADPTWEIRCKAKGTWADLDLQLGQYDSAIPKLENMVQSDTSLHRRTWASMWLTQARLHLSTKTQPGFLLMRACGSEALVL